jgi:ubiquinone/menaquinone biosynthesis C-methylase UbiE
MNRQFHQSDARVLNQRNLERDHRRLAELLRRGLAVLDVGCGTGAITAGIARAVAPAGYAVGVDRDTDLLAIAEKEHRGISNLRFEFAEAATLPFRGEFDIVSAARTLQWIAEPARALARIRDAAKPGGIVVVLDYNHAFNEWEPDPPPLFREFYAAFLTWRDAHGWDNRMADHLPGLFEAAEMADIESRVEDEIATRGDANFENQAALWVQVIEKVGPEIVFGGFLSESRLREVHEIYTAWTKTELAVQTLRLRAVTGRVL